MRLTLEDLASWCGAEVINTAMEVGTTGVSVDSRTLRPGDLFVAISGERFDGHHFVKQAFERGAAAAMVADGETLHGKAGLVVADPLLALGTIAHRQRWTEPLIPWIGVTGSNGKTSTRTILAHILRIRGGVVAPQKNYNNLVGLPLTILNRSDDAWIGVLELGTSAPGEIARLAQIATPTVGIVTGIGPAHIEGLGQESAIAEEKATIFDRLPADGLAIYHADSRYGESMARHAEGRAVVTVGVGCDAGLSAQAVHADHQGVAFSVEGVEFRLPLLGAHSVRNCMTAIAAARHFGVSLEEASQALTTIQPVAQRLEPHQTGWLTLLDDGYNANPSSVRAAVETMGLFESGRRVVIVGDMLELGDRSRALHKEIGHYLIKEEVDVILAVGPKSLSLAEAASSRLVSCQVRHFRTVQSLLRELEGFLRAEDLVLIKGSRGMQMERVTRALMDWTPPGEDVD